MTRLCNYCDSEVSEYKYNYYWCYNCKEYLNEFETTEVFEVENV